MNAMALPALQETFEHLSAAMRNRPNTAVRAGEVVSFSMAKIIKAVDEVVKHQLEVRVLFIKANRDLNTLIRDSEELEIDDLAKYADMIAQMKRVRRDLARPFFVDLDGVGSFKSVADALRSTELRRPPDGRLARRQAKRIDESAELCETQRIKFVSLTDHAVALMEAKVAGNEVFADLLITTIGRQSVERFPVINEYLAR